LCLWYIVSLSLLLTVPGLSLLSQDIDMNVVYAREEKRRGVKAFNGGNFNRAILAFEKALSYTPENADIQEWLGKSYFRSGFTETALNIWEGIIGSGSGTPKLQNLVNVVAYRKGLGRELYDRGRYVISAEIEGKEEDYNLFLRPSSVLTMDNGSFYIVAYGSNEVVLFDTNGALRKRLRGGLYGFDHPFDIAESGDGNFFVTEFEGDRITKCNPDGYVISSFGESGLREGQLMGPQFLTTDGKGYLYVTDYGNRRVSKFDEEGNYILSFGRPTLRFEGLRAPSGIVYKDGRVYVADTAKKLIAVFDESGNFISTLGQGAFHAPEGISLFDDTRLLVADTDRIVTIDLASEQVTAVSDLEGNGEKVLHAELDENGNIISVDFTRGNIAILSELSNLYAGLFVQIDRIYSVDHPRVLLSATVSTRLGNPVTGLDGRNFILTEGYLPVGDQQFRHGVNEANYIDVTLLIDRSPEMERYGDQLSEATAMIYDFLGENGRVRVVSAGETPVVTADENSSRSDIIAAVRNADEAEDWRFDLGLRMAASELFTGTARKAVVFLTHGRVPDDGFRQYGLLESKQFLENNHVPFYCVTLSPEPAVEEINYLCRETGGKQFYLYEPAGIRPLVDHMLESRKGTYYFTYRSPTYADYGREYIPVELEVIHFKRSGRDESGYYAPLQY
jgi:DNA-binding beta-propeller fold protein YncE